MRIPGGWAEPSRSQRFGGWRANIHCTLAPQRAYPEGVRTLLRRLWRIGVSVCAIVGFLLLLVTFTPVTLWWARKLAGPWNDPSGETLIVLGGAMMEDGLIGQTSYWRSVYTRLVYKEGGMRRIIVAGGAADNPVSDA